MNMDTRLQEATIAKLARLTTLPADPAMAMLGAGYFVIAPLYLLLLCL